MSTTVTYKGNTLTTVSNETKKLNTAGTWLEGDITITDSSGGTAAISVVDTTDSHGGTIREITALDISDTTAIASDVASGKYFYTAAGVKTAGTASGGSSGQTATGTFTGDNDITVQIQCSFAPDVIYIYGDLSGDVTNRGVNSFTIVKDTAIYVSSDTSTSSSSAGITYYNLDITGYNESNSSNPHATYSNGVLTIDMVNNTSSNRFVSGITYSYELSTLGGGGGGGSTLITKSISANGTYSASSDSADGYSQVTVAVPNSYSQSDEGKVVSNGALVSQTSQNITTNGTYDTTLKNEVVVSVSGGGTPSATQHTIHLEFSDSTDTDINVYYDNSLLGTMITAYQPSTWTYNNKTVVTAILDNYIWYDKTTTWETLWDSNTPFNSEAEDSFAYITDFASTQITANSMWRVTWGNEVRIHTAVYGKAYPEQPVDNWIIDSLNDGTNGTYTMYSNPNGFWLFIDFDDTTNHNKYVKLEQAVTS